MSLNEGMIPDSPDLNNKGLPVGAVLGTPVQKYTRDPDFYFPDGSAVFLVENVLFKLQASLLAPRDTSTVQCRGSVTTTLFDFTKPSQDQPGRDDDTPVKISQVKLGEFRVLLTILLGRPSNPTYMSLLTDAHSKEKHSQELFLRYLNLGFTSYVFKLNDITRWAFDQLRLVLKSATLLAETRWTTSMLMMILEGCTVADAERLDVACDLRSFFQLLLTTSIIDSTLTMRSQHGPNIKACIALFKSSTSCGPYGGLALGSTLPVLLSLGPHSATWKDRLTRDERSMLYAAYAHFIGLQSNPLLQLGWLEKPASSGVFHDVCSKCAKRMSVAWQDSFGRIGILNSPAPLEDVRKLLALPRCRQKFADSVGRDNSCAMKCGENLLKRIDGTLYDLFACRLVSAYHDLNK